ncbi:MAG: DUF2628 domain-containing protein [Oscillospiraceae bacterium]|nr:DUF2628 domain-containing protein [Oscillospiraceae bacterium]
MKKEKVVATLQQRADQEKYEQLLGAYVGEKFPQYYGFKWKNTKKLDGRIRDVFVSINLPALFFSVLWSASKNLLALTALYTALFCAAIVVTAFIEGSFIVYLLLGSIFFICLSANCLYYNKVKRVVAKVNREHGDLSHDDRFKILEKKGEKRLKVLLPLMVTVVICTVYVVINVITTV